VSDENGPCVIQQRPDPASLHLARRLLDYEDQGPDTAESPALYLVSEKLRRPLSRLAGTAGYRSLLSRALTLASVQAPSLTAVKMNPDGSLDPGGAIGDRRQTTEAGAMLIAQLLSLLILFIGEGLVLSLLSDIWPDFDASVNGSSE
jgi:hypothetical protein